MGVISFPVIELAVLLASGSFALVCLSVSLAVLWKMGLLEGLAFRLFPSKFQKEAPMWQGADGEALPYDEARQSWEKTFSGRAPHASWSEIN